MSNLSLKIISLILALIIISCSEDTIDVVGVGTVTGKVVSVGTNEPLENVKIATNPSTSIVFTDEEGAYVLEDVPAGDYSISAEQEGLLTAFEGISVIADGQLEIVFEMDSEDANNRPPEEVILESPEDNSTDVATELELVWSSEDPDEDELTYTITLRNDENDEVLIFENIVDTTYTISDLLYGVKYFWQVSATDNVNAAINSEINAFETTLPANNRIVYTRFVDGNNVIYSSDEEGETELQLTSETKNSFRPRRNSTTNTIAFLQSVGAQIHLFTMEADGSNVTQVTSAIGVSGFNLEEIDFSWSTNGSKLLFPNQDKLYSINVDGSGLTVLYQTTGNLITEVDANDASGLIALKTNNLDGYEVEIFTIDAVGVVQDVVLSGELGAAGSVNLSVDGSQLLYTRDISGAETSSYRQLNSHMFVYDFTGMTTTDISIDKIDGTNDLDARFSPNDASVIFVNTSNDGISVKNVQTMFISNTETRTTLIENAFMSDWE